MTKFSTEFTAALQRRKLPLINRRISRRDIISFPDDSDAVRTRAHRALTRIMVISVTIVRIIHLVVCCDRDEKILLKKTGWKNVIILPYYCSKLKIIELSKMEATRRYS
jgi:hypothetical protein